MKDGRDIVAQAQSGKGKTGAFTVASLAIIDCEKRFPQVVILSPTRELSDQTYVVTRKLGANLKGLSVAECVGGSPVRECIRILRTGPQVNRTAEISVESSTHLCGVRLSRMVLRLFFLSLGCHWYTWTDVPHDRKW